MSVKQYIAKYFLNLFTIAMFLSAMFFFYDYYRRVQKEQKDRELLEERYGKLIGETEKGKILDFATQLSTSYKEQAELAKDARDAWKQLAIEREERIKLISSASILVDSNEKNQAKSDIVADGYVVNELRIGGDDSPPIGYVMIKDDGSVYKKNYKFEIRIESIQLKDDLTGKIRVVSRAFLVPLETGVIQNEWKDKKYPLPITGGNVQIDPKEPILADIKNKGLVVYPMNINAGFGAYSNSKGEVASKFFVDTSLLGYGYHKRDLDWKFLNLGINYNDTTGLGFHVMPFSYRLFPEVLTNSYFGLGFSTTQKDYEYFIGASTGL